MQATQTVYRVPSSPTVVIRRVRNVVALHKQINLSDREQVERLCREFGTTKLHLFSTVERIGNDVFAVRQALRIR